MTGPIAAVGGAERARRGAGRGPCAARGARVARGRNAQDEEAARPLPGRYLPALKELARVVPLRGLADAAQPELAPVGLPPDGVLGRQLDVGHPRRLLLRAPLARRLHLSVELADALGRGDRAAQRRLVHVMRVAAGHLDTSIEELLRRRERGRARPRHQLRLLPHRGGAGVGARIEHGVRLLLDAGDRAPRAAAGSLRLASTFARRPFSRRLAPALAGRAAALPAQEFFHIGILPLLPRLGQSRLLDGLSCRRRLLLLTRVHDHPVERVPAAVRRL